MIQPDTLLTRLRAELDRRLAVARAATPGPWTARGIGDYGWSVHFEGGMPRGIETEDNKQGRDDAEYIALHDPADATRRYQGELEVLERHMQVGERCRCWNDWPCLELTGLAHRLGVNLDD